MALRLGLMVADGASATIVFLLVSLARFGDGQWLGIWQRFGIDIRLAAILFGFVWVGALWYRGLYRLRARWRLQTEALDIFRATILVAAFALSALFVLKQVDVSRLFLLTLFIVQPLVALAGRATLRAGFGLLRQRGYNARFMLVVGSGRLAQDFADLVESRPVLGIRVIGHLSVPGDPPEVVTRPIVGNVDDITTIFHSETVDEVAVCLEREAVAYLAPVIRLAANEGKTVRVPTDPMDDALAGASEEEFEGMVVRSLAHDGQRELGFAIKRLLDIGGAIVGLVILSPLLVGAAVLVRLRDGPPVLFRQTRIGLHGRPFTIYKFRTMVADAEDRLAEVAHLNERTAVAFKAANDPRVTSLGRTLRQSSIDELPQLWNVLLGQMSLVGPRPPLPSEVDLYDIWHRRRLSMKPGITGLWQVEARRDPDFDRWVERDLIYIDQWSLGLDLRILALTIPAMLRGEGS
jgi:exopolysaccharide biosynthesis polyprenyl glycosylphosphotransferase